MLSDTSYVTVHINVAVIIHEILHILGIGAGTRWDNVLTNSNNTFYTRTGLDGILKHTRSSAS